MFLVEGCHILYLAALQKHYPLIKLSGSFLAMIGSSSYSKLMLLSCIENCLENLCFDYRVLVSSETVCNIVGAYIQHFFLVSLHISMCSIPWLIWGIEAYSGITVNSPKYVCFFFLFFFIWLCTTVPHNHTSVCEKMFHDGMQ